MNQNNSRTSAPETVFEHVGRIRWLDYLFTIMLEVGLALLLWLADIYLPVPRYPAPFVLMMLVIAYLFGEGPAILALVISLFAFEYLFVPPVGRFWPIAETAIDWGAVIEFLAITIVAGIAGIIIRRSHHRIQSLVNQLSESNRRVTTTLESITDAFFSLDHDWRFTYVNSEAEHLFEISRQQVLGTQIWQQMPELKGTIFQTEFEKATREQSTVQFQGHYRQLDRWYSVRVYPSTLGLSIYADDITDRKWTEDALRASEKKFRTIFDNAGDALFILDRAGKILEVNSIAVQRLGYDRDEFLQMTAMNVDTPEYAPRALERIDEMNKKGSAVFETAHRRKDGTSMPVEVNIHAVDFAGTPAVLAIARDITERKLAEAKIRESESRLNHSQAIAHLGSWELDLVKNQLTWSDEVYRIFGLQPQEFGATYDAFLDFIHPDDRQMVDEAYSGSIREGLKRYEVEHRVIRKDSGEIRFVHELCEHIRDQAGNIIRSIGMVQDITDRKRKEKELKEAHSETQRRAAELESFFTSMAEGAAVFDTNGNMVRANKASRKILGAPPDLPTDALSKSYRLETLEGQAVRHEDYVSYRAIRGETLVGLRFKMVTPWANVPVSLSSGPIRDRNGKVVGAAVVWTDISEILATEQAQQRVYEREHHIAEVLQEALLGVVPERIDGFAFQTIYQAALEEARVGGDFYDLFRIGTQKIGIVIGDVSGKGLPAAIYVATARHSIRSRALFDSIGPAAVLDQVNKVLVADMNVEGFATLFFGILDCNTKTLTYANAGHSPAILWQAEPHKADLINPTGTVLGIDEGTQYQESTIQLHRGDELLLGTDGLYEVQCEGDYLDIDGLIELYTKMKLAGEDSATELISQVMIFCKSVLRDDVAVLKVSVIDE